MASSATSTPVTTIYPSFSAATYTQSSDQMPFEGAIIRGGNIHSERGENSEVLDLNGEALAGLYFLNDGSVERREEGKESTIVYPPQASAILNSSVATSVESLPRHDTPPASTRTVFTGARQLTHTGYPYFQQQYAAPVMPPCQCYITPMDTAIAGLKQVLLERIDVVRGDIAALERAAVVAPPAANLRDRAQPVAEGARFEYLPDFLYAVAEAILKIGSKPRMGVKLLLTSMAVAKEILSLEAPKFLQTVAAEFKVAKTILTLFTTFASIPEVFKAVCYSKTLGATLFNTAEKVTANFYYFVETFKYFEKIGLVDACASALWDKVQIFSIGCMLVGSLLSIYKTISNLTLAMQRGDVGIAFAQLFKMVLFSALFAQGALLGLNAAGMACASEDFWMMLLPFVSEVGGNFMGYMLEEVGGVKGKFTPQQEAVGYWA